MILRTTKQIIEESKEEYDSLVEQGIIEFLWIKNGGAL